MLPTLLYLSLSIIASLYDLFVIPTVGAAPSEVVSKKHTAVVGGVDFYEPSSIAQSTTRRSLDRVSRLTARVSVLPDITESKYYKGWMKRQRNRWSKSEQDWMKSFYLPGVNPVTEYYSFRYPLDNNRGRSLVDDGTAAKGKNNAGVYMYHDSDNTCMWLIKALSMDITDERVYAEVKALKYAKLYVGNGTLDNRPAIIMNKVKGLPIQLTELWQSVDNQTKNDLTEAIKQLVKPQWLKLAMDDRLAHIDPNPSNIIVDLNQHGEAAEVVSAVIVDYGFPGIVKVRSHVRGEVLEEFFDWLWPRKWNTYYVSDSRKGRKTGEVVKTKGKKGEKTSS
ncbi:hypothetical protein J3R30DRAFT_3411925 [Lentinula aciculospora]|uniref:Protein kinase domain-containing protein n=1 Tax=Lentinula aciculospora TaxID=153920 RepID=A0A9W8ZU80_9AGAR|nr:hypothetical protein J3R30DRAFT_3411925 [Lentinula aciculospora]